MDLASTLLRYLVGLSLGFGSAVTYSCALACAPYMSSAVPNTDTAYFKLGKPGGSGEVVYGLGLRTLSTSAPLKVDN